MPTTKKTNKKQKTTHTLTPTHTRTTKGQQAASSSKHTSSSKKQRTSTQPSASSPSPSIEPPYTIGQSNLQCRCNQINDNTLLDIEILDRRIPKKDKQYNKQHSIDANENDNDSTSSSSSSPTEEYEYYIHYVGMDRRLDTWVAEDDIHHKSQHTAFHIPSPHKSSSSSSASALSSSMKRNTTRMNKRTSDLSSVSSDAVIDANERLLEVEHEKKTRIKNIQRIEIGDYELDCWYYSPFPSEYRNVDKLYVCQWCLKYTKYVENITKHEHECKYRHPPGTEIYRDTGNHISVFEVDGAKHKLYCQCLCLVGKLFIDHKTLYYDVDTFLFYTLCEHTSSGMVIVGYFSKEKVSSDNNNLACILTFPQYQRKGYGKFLIALSYALTRIESTVGSPEKPLSDLGKVSYRSYWISVIISYLYTHLHRLQNITLLEISNNTGIKQEDVISALQAVSLVRYLKGEHLLAANVKAIQQHYKQQEELKQKSIEKGHVLFDPKLLVWQAPIPSSNNNGSINHDDEENRTTRSRKNPTTASSSKSSTKTTKTSGGGGAMNSPALRR